ncbi:Ig-like domain-containing protein [Bradyrhizobium sp.]|uniref:Ig-like domain-containing protein n=1 Tax=Bradyrhizobium sp. TaxID=376 RepID=UPI0040380336
MGGDGYTVINTTTTTTSADGLTVTTMSNVGGDNTITTDTTTISADGARKRVIEVAAPGAGMNPTQVLLSMTEIVTRSDQKTTVVKEDTNGDGAVDRLTVSYLQASGTTVDEISIFAPDGSLVSETRRVISADGLATTETTNIDGKIDSITTYVTVLNLDGGHTETVTRRANDGTLNSQTVTTTSGDGFASATTTSIDGKIDSTVTDVSSIAANGDEIETITAYDAQNVKISATRITTSANGLLQASLIDENGDGTFDVQTVDQTTLNATDGSLTQLVTTTTVAASPVTLGRIQTVTSADGLTVVTSVDHTGNGVYDEVTSVVGDAAGNVVTTVDHFDPSNPNNRKINETVTIARGNGLFNQVKVDVDGDGTFDQVQTDSIAFAQDGTQTETVTTLAGTTTIGTTVVTTNANGTTVTTQKYIGGTAATGRLVETYQSQISYNLDGSVTTNSTMKARNSIVFEQSTTQVSADQKTTSITTNFLQASFAGNQTDAPESVLGTISELTDGSLRDTTTYYASASAAGAILATKTVQTSANGLSKTLSWDLNGDGTIDQNQSYATEIGTDGSTDEAFADAFTGTGFAMHVAVGRSTSANGLTGSLTASINLGESWSLIDGSRDTFLNPDGSASVVTKNNILVYRSSNTQNYSLVYAGSDAAVVSTSRDGLTTTKQISTWGNNTFYRTNSFTTNLDGSTTQTITNLNDDNSLGEAKAVNVSADGRIITITDQTNEHGYVNYAVQTTVPTNDGSGYAVLMTTTSNYASNGGTLRNRETESTLLNGLSKTTSLDVNGDEIVDESKTDVTTLTADGRTIQTITETDASGIQIKKQVVTTSADGLHKTTTIAGSGAVLATTQTDTVDNSDGSTTTTAITTSPGTAGSTLTRNTTLINTSADGRVTNVTWDLDGDQTLEAAESSVTHADGSRTVTDTYYQADGTTVSSVTTTTTSANGLMTTVSRSITANAASNTTEIALKSSDGSGSYTWTEKDASGNNVVHASHTIDQNGIDYVNLWVRGTEVTYRISADQEAHDLAEVQSIYTVLLGRTMSPEETQTWLKYYTNSGLNVVQLAKDLMNSTEFWQDNDIAFRRDYGSQNRPDLVTLLNTIYQNAFGRLPSQAEQSSYISRVYGSNLDPMADFVVEIARIANPAGVPNAGFNLQATSPYPLPFGAGGGGGGGVPDSIETLSTSYGRAVEHYDQLTGFLKRIEYYDGAQNYMTRNYDPLTGALSSEYGYFYDQTGTKVANAYIEVGNRIDVYAGIYNPYNLFDSVNDAVQITNNPDGTSTWTLWQQNLPQNRPLGTVKYFKGTSVDRLRNPAISVNGHLSYSKIYDASMGFYVEKSASSDSFNTPLYNVIERTDTGIVLARGTDFAARSGSDFTFYDPAHQLAPFISNIEQFVSTYAITSISYSSTGPDGSGVISFSGATSSLYQSSIFNGFLDGFNFAFSPLHKMLPETVPIPANTQYSYPTAPDTGSETGSANSPTTPAGGFSFTPPSYTLPTQIIDTQVGYVSGTGGDIFIYDASYGAVEIDENDPSPTPQNILKLGSMILPSNIRVTADSSGSLYITDGTTGDVIKLAGMLSDSSRGVQSVQFTSNNTTWTRTQLIQAAATGTTAADKLYGTSGAEAFDGKGGNDYVSGNGGGDTIIYERGYGHLEIDQRDILASPSNVLRLNGINSTEVILVSDGTNLYITDGRVGDRIKIDNMVSDGMFGVQKIEFADATWHWSDIQSRMKAAIVGSSGSDVLNGGLGADIVLYRGNASDYLISTNAAGVTTVTDTVAGRDGTDTLTGIEYLQFADLTDAPPVAHDDVGWTDTGRIVTATPDQVLGNDSDADAGDMLTIVNVSALSARGAAVSFQNGLLSYDPTVLRGTIPAGETVTDTFTYTMRDAAGATSTATVTMTVSEANHAPVAHDDVGFAWSNAVAHAPADTFALANDTDEDAGDTKTIVSVSALSAKGAAVSFHDGELYYDPRTAFAGLLVGQHATDTFTYTMSDSAGARSTATVTMYIDGAGHAPVANDDIGPTISEENTATLLAVDLLANDADADAGDTRTLVSVAAISAKGAAVSIKNGNVVYDPRGAAVLQGLAANDITTDTFTYTMRDAGGSFSTATVTMTITGSNDGATPDGVFRIGSDFVANTQTAGSQTAPKVTGLRNGGFVVTWVDDSQTGGDASGSSVKAQVFRDNGDKVGSEFLVNTQTTNGQLAPAVVALAGGGFVMTWEDNSSTLGDSDGSSIKAQLFDAAGGKIGSEFLVNSLISHNQKAPEVAALPNGGFVISWQDFSAGTNNGTNYNIKVQVFAANGDMVGSELAVAAQSANSRYSSGIVGLANGDFVVSWEDLSPGDGSSSGIRARIFHRDGTEVTGEFLVNTEVTGGQNIPAVALADGGFVVAWNGGDSSFNGIKGQIFDASGNKMGSEFLVNTQTLSNQINPSISALPGGGFIVSWVDTSGTLGDSDGTSVKAQVFDASGAKVGSEFLVNTQALGDQLAPKVVGLADGKFVIAWQRDDGVIWGVDEGGQPINSDVNIRAQVFGLSLPRTINGTSGDDVLVGGIGPDTLVGHGGNDTYRFDAIQKSEIVVNGSEASTGPSGTLQFTASNPDQLWFERESNDLTIDVLGTERKVIVQNWYGAPGAQLGSIQANNLLLSNNQVDALVQAMAAFENSYASAHGGADFDPATAASTIADTSVLAAVNNNWHQAA